MKKLLPVFIIAGLFVYYFHSIKQQKPIQQKEKDFVTISFVGDLMCHAPQYEYARVEKDKYDFRSTFQEIKKYFSQSDLVIGNLETVVHGGGTKLGSYPLFNSPIEFLDALKYAGFNLLITSNNHSLDRGINGIEKTIDNLDKLNIAHTGTYKSIQDRDSIRMFILNKIKIALLAYTYGVNGNFIPSNKKFCVNLIDTNAIRNDIKKIRQNADLVIVYFHFGEEYQRQQNNFQKEIADKTILYGANFIIASHPHVIQPMEYFISQNENLKQGFTAYSLGNFISNQRWRHSDCGVILNFRIERMQNKKLELDSVWITPTWVFKGNVNGKNQFVILPSDTNKTLPAYLNKFDKEKLAQSFWDTKRTLIAVDSVKRKTSLP